MITALLFLILVGVIWTITGIVMGSAARQDVSNELMQCISYALGTMTCLALLPLYPTVQVTGNLAFFALGMYFLAGVFNFFLNLAMAGAMKRGPNSIVWAIIQAGMVIPFMVGICVHDVHAGPSRLLGMLSMLAALVLISMDKKSRGETSGRLWLLLSFAGFLIVGVQQSISTEPSYYPEIRTGIPIVHRCLALCSGNLVATLPLLLRQLFKGNFKQLRGELGRKWLWFYALLLQASILIEKLFLSFRAMDMMAKLGNGAISYPVMVISCIAAFTLYSIAVLHEKVTWYSAIGLFLCTLGIVMLSV